MLRITQNYERRREVRAELHAVETTRNVKVLFACEAGSRAWGFPGTDSDFDVRFIYVRPISSYLGLAARRDVIENSDLKPGKDMDLAGWDIQKALELAAKSNPAMLEWIHGPTTYYEFGEFAKELRDIMLDYEPKALAHHYASMAHSQYKNYLDGTGEKVLYKKYLYALRPIFCVLWLSMNNRDVARGCIPPVVFEDLLREVASHREVAPLIPSINILLLMKAGAAESDRMPRFDDLDEFISNMVEHTRILAKNSSDHRRPDLMALESLCVRTIKQFNG